MIIVVYEIYKKLKYLRLDDPINNPNNKKSTLEHFNYTYLNLETDKLTQQLIERDPVGKYHINHVVSSEYPDYQSEIFKPLNLDDFNTYQNRWTVAQRPWNESWTYLDPVIKQHQESQKYWFKHNKKYKLGFRNV